MASLLDIQRMGTILERKTSSQRMKSRATAGGRIDPDSKSAKKKKKQKSHIDNHWEDVLRDTWS